MQFKYVHVINTVNPFLQSKYVITLLIINMANPCPTCCVVRA